MISFDCPQCGFSKDVPDKFAGRKVVCPKCAANSLVPNASTDGATPAISAAAIPANAPPPLPKQIDWYFAIAETRNGPHTLAEMQQFVTAGSINRQTSVWCEGMQDWLPAKDTELETAFPAKPPSAAAGVTPTTNDHPVVVYLNRLVLGIVVGLIVWWLISTMNQEAAWYDYQEWRSSQPIR